MVSPDQALSRASEADHPRMVAFRVGAVLTMPRAIVLGALLIAGAVLWASRMAPYRLAGGESSLYRLNVVTGRVVTCNRVILKVDRFAGADFQPCVPPSVSEATVKKIEQRMSAPSVAQKKPLPTLEDVLGPRDPAKAASKR